MDWSQLEASNIKADDGSICTMNQAIARASCQIEDLKHIQAEHIARSTMNGSLALGLGLLTAGASIAKAQ